MTTPQSATPETDAAILLIDCEFPECFRTADGKSWVHDAVRYDVSRRLEQQRNELLAALELCETELAIMADMFPNACTKRHVCLAAARAAIANAKGAK